MTSIEFALLRDLAMLSNQAYSGDNLFISSTLPSGWRYVSPGELGMEQVGVTQTGNFIFRYNGVDVTLSPNGAFVGSSFNSNAMYLAINDELGKVAAVFRGTDPNLTGLADISGTYFNIADDDLSDELTDFNGIFDAVTDYISDSDGPAFGYELVATGHSLGGALAAELLNLSADFNTGYGFGTPGMSVNLGNSFLNVRHNNDPVGQFLADRFGMESIIIYSDYVTSGRFFDLDAHKLGGYLDDFGRMFNNGLESNYILAEDLNIFLPLDSSDSKILVGTFEDDLIFGSLFRNDLRGSGGNDEIRAGSSNDTVFGGTGNDTIYGQGGADELLGEEGDDVLYGGSENDVIFGGESMDRLFGETGADDLRGQLGADTLYGGTDRDKLDGGEGADHLYGEGGLDDYVGGSGSDTFYFDSTSVALFGPIQVEHIRDYNQGDGAYSENEGDIIDISAIVSFAGGIGQSETSLWKIEHQFGFDYLVVDPDGAGSVYGWQAIAQLHGLPSGIINLNVRTGSTGAGTSTQPVPSAPGSYSISPASRTVDEDIGTISFTITRPDDRYAETVFVSTTFNRGSANNGDYQGMLNVPRTFITGQSSLTVEIAINDDSADEALEQFGLIIQSSPDQPAGQYLASSSFTIIDDDSGTNGTFTTGDDVVLIAAPNGPGLVRDGLAGDDIAVVDMRTATGGFSTSRNNLDGSFGVESGDNSLILRGIESFMIIGGSGNDSIQGGAGNDFLFGGGGNDVVDPGGPVGTDILDGGAGDDSINNVGFGDTVEGGSGTDQLTFDLLGVSSGVTINLLTGQGAGANWTGIEYISGRLGDGNDDVTVAGQFGSLNGGGGANTLTANYSAASYFGQTVTSFSLGRNVNGQPFAGLILSSGSVTSFSLANFESFNITGTANADSIQGGNSGNRLFGGGGADGLYGGAGIDLLDGGAGDDSFNEVGLGDTVEGGSGSDFLYFNLAGTTGGLVLNLLTGEGAGASWTGIEYLSGTLGFGNDSVTVAGQFASIDGGGGTNTLTADYSAASYFGQTVTGFSLSRNANGNLLAGVNLSSGSIDSFSFSLPNFESFNITGTANADYIQGGNSGNRLFGGGGADGLYGGAGIDLLDGGAGDDSFNEVGLGDTVEGGSGSDFLYFNLAGTTGGLVLNLLTGEGAGASWTGIEYLSGTLGFGNDSVTVAGQFASIDGGGGTNTLTADYSAASYFGQTVTGFSLSRNANGNLLAGVNLSSGSIDSFSFSLPNFESFNITGTANADYIQGGNSGNRLFGGGGADGLYGGAGIDLLDGGAGDDSFNEVGLGDTVEGGSGSDFLYFNLAGTTGGLVLNLLTGEGAGASWTGIEYLSGTLGFGNDSVTVAGQFASIDGGGGTNTLTADYSAASYFGQTVTGFSLSRNANGNLLAGVNLSSGSIDSFSFSLPNFESFNITGTANADYIQGGNSGNRLFGGGGADGLYGGAGIDLLDGGDGDDSIHGGSGDDTLRGGLGKDVLDGSLGYDTADFSDRTGAITLSLNGNGTVTVFIDGVEEDTLSGIESIGGGAGITRLTGDASSNILNGGSGDNTLDGGAGDDTLIGGSGDDVMIGGSGNDIFFVDAAGDAIIEADGEGIDRIIASANYNLATNAVVETLEAAAASATTAIDLTGSDTANAIFGNAGANRLDGAGGNDTLHSFGGDDYLVGGSGLDNLYGGVGDDRFFIGSADGDRIWEFAGEGYDTVSSAVDYELPDVSDVERLEAGTLSATTALYLGGSNLDNLIIGNAGDNRLRGFAGNDTLHGLAGDDFLIGDEGADVMYGGPGNDTFYVNTSDDRIFEDVGEGTADRVATEVSFTLPDEAEVEILEAVNLNGTTVAELGGSRFANVITGDAGNNLLRGYGGDDTLTGHTGNDVLIGDTGNDRMIGGAGNDTYFVDAAGDVVVEEAGQGTDRVSTSVSYALTASAAVETLEASNLGSLDPLSLTGSNTANTIIGNNGANRIDGKGGNDVLVGAGGADTFVFSSTLGAGNIDRIADFQVGIDKIALENDIFTFANPGSLDPAFFRAGPAAQDADDRIIYDPATGALYYDADGNGVGAAIQFGVLQAGLPLNATDFMVI